MPTLAVSKFTMADALDGGLSNRAVASSLAKPTMDVDLSDKEMLAAYKKINVKAVAGLKPGRYSDLFLEFKTPLELATAYIEAKYQSLGGAGGFLKAATTAVTVCPDGKGYYRHFQGGSIYWHAYTGAHEVHGLIRHKWANLGWEKSFLGYPTSDETVGRDNDGAGRFSHFQGGSIYWHPTVGTFEVHGAIRQKYLELGAEASFLGYPTTDELGTPDGVGRFNHFQAGSIYWTPSTWAHEVHGLIRGYWADHGWERNAALGYPITDELIPSRTAGHLRPGSIRRPDIAVATDLIRLPEGATTPGMTVRPEITRSATLTAVSATPTATMATSRTASPAMLSAATMTPERVTAAPAATTLPTGISPGTLARIDPGMFAVFTQMGVSQGAKEGGVSRNRFSDFENGVVFWQRGSSTAYKLSPWNQTATGQKLALSSAEVIGIASLQIRNALSRLVNTQVPSISFAGVTGYMFDGAGVHNRRHRAIATLMAIGFNGPFPIPVQATVEIQVEVAFDPIHWRIAGQLTHWRLLSTSGQFPGGALDRQLHGALDSALWVPFTMLSIPSQDGVPLPVLSVKTMPNGDVDVYIEP
jgi:LGFP repeat